MNKTIRWIIIILVAFIALLIGLKSCGIIGKEEGIKVSVEKAEVRTIIETVTASGKVYPEIEVKVSPDISGEIVALTVAEGDSVKKGQLLAKIYADIYQSQRTQVEAGVNQAEAGLSNANAGLGALKANLDQAQTNYARQQKLLADKIISRAEFEQAEQAFLAAQSNYNAAKEGLKSNQASIKSAKAQLDKANQDLSRTSLFAPIDGVVSLLSVKKGERVAGNSFNVGTEMLRIADLGSIVAQVDVGENDIPKIKLGDTALVTVDAYNNRKFKGLVYKIANPQTNALASNSSTDVTNYKVHIRLMPESYKDLIGKGRFPFRPGMSATADIQTHTEPNVITIPLNAVTIRDKKKDTTKTATPKVDNPSPTSDKDNMDIVVFVYDAAKSTVKQTIVKTGVQDINFIQIKSGVNAGQEIVTGPYNTISKLLKDGQKALKTDKDKLFEEKDLEKEKKGN